MNKYRRIQIGPISIRTWVALFVVVGLLGAFIWIDRSSRRELFRLAERMGLWQEEEHELVPVRDEKGEIKYWTCTMHPSVRAAGPGKCPI
ncbi:MAG: heavy metal-binding domain-containing protein [Acidobacteriota bacterium]